MRLPENEAVAITNKAFEVLLFLVKNSGKLVTKEDLMAEVWQGSYVEEANLTQTIFLVRKTLGENPNQHRFIVTETGRGYRFVSPVYESSDIQNTDLIHSNTASSDRQVQLVAIGILAVSLFVVVGYYFWDKNEGPISQSSSVKEVKTIAVLPFRNIEPHAEDQLLGIGMADAVITKLSQIKSILVLQTKSVMRYADSTPEAIAVGREINVDAVLEGTIQKADGRIRVSMRLYQVRDGALLWAANFDELYSSIFMLQDSISEQVANSLSLELNKNERDNLKKRYTENIEAYQLYNKGRFFWNNRNSEDLTKSIVFFEQAIAKDENYALAYAGLAESYVLLQLFSQSQKEDYFPKAKWAAEKALSLDEHLAEARTALALYKEQYEWDWQGAETEFKRAISANPSYATAHQWYGEFLAFMGRTNESIAEVEKAVELDPLSLSTNTSRAFPYLAARRYDETINKAKAVLELESNFPLALYYLGRGYDGKGRHIEAIDAYKNGITASGGSTFFASALIYALVKSGQTTQAEKVFAELSDTGRKQSISRYALARSLAALGKKKEALDELEAAFQNRDGLLIILKIDQNFDEMRDEARLQEILRKMNF